MFFSLKYILSNSRSLEAERTQTWFSHHYFSLILSKAGMSMNFCDDACCTCISYCSLCCDQRPYKKQPKGRHGGRGISKLLFKSVNLLAHTWADQGVERGRNNGVQLSFSVLNPVLASSPVDSTTYTQSGSSIRECPCRHTWR